MAGDSTARRPWAPKAPQATAMKPLRAATIPRDLVMVSPSTWGSERRKAAPERGFSVERAACPGPGSGPHGHPDLLHGVLLQLANTLGGDAVLIRQVVEGGLVVVEPALLENVAAALVEGGEGVEQALLAGFLPVRLLQLQGGIGAAILQVVDRGLPGVVLVVVGGIEGGVPGGQALLHLPHLVDLDTEVIGNGRGLVVVEPAEAFLGAAQVEEQLALGLGGGHPDDAPVAQDVLVNLGL